MLPLIALPPRCHPPSEAGRVGNRAFSEISGEGRTRFDEESGYPLPAFADFAKTLRHGYYACISNTDAQIGKVLDAMIVLWDDAANCEQGFVRR